ncbi:hypothetical protein ACIBJF_04420 [Streptomyces sp. NPDC050743]|uniref:hypothetical protein n=1 Tax=Streptomyces sp. NPDC050743 TaxID=3365634 RepID=UPI0037921FE7
MGMRDTGVVRAVLTAAVLVGAAGCGAQQADRAATAALARAGDRTDALGSAHVRMSVDYGMGGTPVAMEGTYSWGHGYAYDVEMDTRQTNMQKVRHAPRIRCLLVHGVYYYDIDPQRSGPLKGKQWMKVDSSALYGAKGAKAAAGTGSSPSATLMSLRHADKVDTLGTPTVDGHRTTHYRAVVGRAHWSRRFADVYGNPDTPMGSVTAGAADMTADVWIGADGLPVRLREEIGLLTLTMDLDGFGATATVEAPPAAQTGDVTELVKRRQWS